MSDKTATVSQAIACDCGRVAVVVAEWTEREDVASLSIAEERDGERLVLGTLCGRTDQT